MTSRKAPAPNPSADLRGAGLTIQETTLLAQVNGLRDEAALADVSGLPLQTVQRLLRTLQRKNVILWASTMTVEPAEQERQRLLNEDGDLDRGQRLRILAALRDLRERTHWQVLGLTGHPSASEIKNAYLTLSKTHHPDRYFGRQLGSFASLIEQVFRGVKGAYDVLSDEPSRRAYERQHPAPPRHQPLPDKRFPTPAAHDEATVKRRLSTAQHADLERHRQEILEQRRKKRQQPATDRAHKATAMYKAGVASLQEGDLLGADNKLQLAVAFAPNNREYQSRYKEVHTEANRRRAKQFTEAGDLELATGQTQRAAQQYALAAELSPRSANKQMSVAQCFYDAGEHQKAKPYAEKAIKAAPRRLEARVLAAKVYVALADKPRALAHLEVAASIDKSDSTVKKALRQLKKLADK